MTLDEIKERVCESLQEQREQAGYKSAAAFARAVGISAGRYRSYETGRRGISIEDAWKFADILGITLDELVGRDFRPEHESSGFDTLPIEEAKLIMDWRSLDDRGRETVETVMDVQLASGDSVPEEKNLLATES